MADEIQGTNNAGMVAEIMAIVREVCTEKLRVNPHQTYSLERIFLSSEQGWQTIGGANIQVLAVHLIEERTTESGKSSPVSNGDPIKTKRVTVDEAGNVFPVSVRE